MTLDMDWAPDWMLEDAAALLDDYGVRCTWFATHESPLVRQIEKNPLFEIGLHPNFLPGSTQGETPRQVMEHLRSLFPDAFASRCHSLHQSERLLQMLCEEYGIRVDCSLYLPGCCGQGVHSLRYSEGGPELLRIPHIFQDNMHLAAKRDFSLAHLNPDHPGIKVVNFHPIHIALNTTSLEHYTAIGQKKHSFEITKRDAEDWSNAGKEGIRDLFVAALKRISSQHRQWTIGDLAHVRAYATGD